MARITKRCDVRPEDAGRLDLVVQKLTGLPRRQIRGLFDHGTVTRNSEVCQTGHERAVAGDVIEVIYDPHQRYHEKRDTPERGNSFRTVFQDRFLIVVEKRAGVLTVPTRHEEQNTLLHQVEHFVRRLGPTRKIHVVHRLDRDTSGLLVLAKDPRTAEALEAQFRAHSAERVYLAVLAGSLPRDEGTIESYLATGEGLQRYSADDASGGERAVTHYRVECRVKNSTTVRVTLETGRRNQIRVHFAEAGHPVLGDARYRPDLARTDLWKHDRLALHAVVLGFRHPVTGGSLRYEAPPPREFQAFLRRQ